jgi:hypothetical protein
VTSMERYTTTGSVLPLKTDQEAGGWRYSCTRTMTPMEADMLPVDDQSHQEMIAELHAENERLRVQVATVSRGRMLRSATKFMTTVMLIAVSLISAVPSEAKGPYAYDGPAVRFYRNTIGSIRGMDWNNQKINIESIGKRYFGKSIRIYGEIDTLDEIGPGDFDISFVTGGFDPSSVINCKIHGDVRGYLNTHRKHSDGYGDMITIEGTVQKVDIWLGTQLVDCHIVKLAKR